MLTLGSSTHKICKITSLTAYSFKQLFTVITMLLTVLSVQQSSNATIFAMAAPAAATQQPSVAAAAAQQHNLLQQQQHHYTHPHRRHPPRPLQSHQHEHHTPPQQQEEEQQQQQHHQPYPETQLDFLLAENDDNNNSNNKNDYYHRQSETDIETEERLLQKRHTSSWHAYYAETMNSKKIEWQNPCGGHYVNINTKPKAKTKPAVRKTLRTLQNATVRIFNSLGINQLYSIDIRNMSMWDTFDENYKFLPTMGNKSNISLRRWYRQMEYYIASFDYLHRAQLYWDYNKDMQQSEISRELYTLRNNAREILCIIENAINNTTINSKAKRTIDSLLIPRDRMESQLQFATNIRHVSPLQWDTMQTDNDFHVNPVDLRFAKSRYLKYVRNLIKFLRVTTKGSGPLHLGGGKRKKNENSKRKDRLQQQNSTSTKRQRQQHQQRQIKRKTKITTAAKLE